jgi:type I restriction enzyme R subunit
VKDFERDVYLSGEAEALQYRRRLKAILDDMLVDNPILQKIYNEEPYQLDELKTLTSTILTSNPGVNLDILNQFYGRTANQLHETIRELIGMDPQAVEKHFTDFLHKHSTLTAQQVRFMNLLKNHISQHGTISVEKLYEPPFDSVSHEGVDGVFKPEDVDALVTVLKPFWSQESSQ